MCSCEGKQIQLLLENSSRECQKPTSCIFAKNPHAPCFPTGGAHCGDFRHHCMAWEETFEAIGAGALSPAAGNMEMGWSQHPPPPSWTSLRGPGACHRHHLCGTINSQCSSQFALSQLLPGAPSNSCTKSVGMPLRNISWETLSCQLAELFEKYLLSWQENAYISSA